VRQTLGFSAGPGQRRASARLSHAQIGRAIGRSSTAMSQAIDTLVKKGLLEALSDDGRMLSTGTARRTVRAPLHFRVPKSWVESPVDKSVDSIPHAK